MTIDVKHLAASVVTVAAAVSAVLAVVLTQASTVHLGARWVAIIVAASAVVTAVLAQARVVAGQKVAAYRQAKHSAL